MRRELQKKEKDERKDNIIIKAMRLQDVDVDKGKEREYLKGQFEVEARNGIVQIVEEKKRKSKNNKNDEKN